MALTVINDPATTRGVTDVEKREANHVPTAVFGKPEWDQILVDCGLKWILMFFLRERFGFKTVTNKVWNWAESGKWYSKQVTSAAADDGSNVTFTYTNTAQYFIVTDIIDLGIEYPSYPGLNLQGRVVDAGTSGGFGFATVQILDPQGTAGAINAASFPNGTEQALISNSQGECFLKPGIRKNTPERFFNTTTKVANTGGICDEADRTVTWFQANGSTPYWLPYDTEVTIKQHMMATDMAILMGMNHVFTDSEGYEGSQGNGLIPLLNYSSLVRGYAGAILESDIQEVLQILSNNSDGTDWLLVAGSDLAADFNRAMREYVIEWGNAPNYDINVAQRVGLNVDMYNFAGKTVELLEYKGFGDPDFLPANAGGVDYKKYGLLLCKDADSIKIVHRVDKKARQIKAWPSYQYGQTMQAPGETHQLDRACFEMTLTSEVGIEAKCLNKHGVLVGQ